MVPLENILKVTSVDNITEPYQFKIFIEGKKVPEVWTLKARTEASSYTQLNSAAVLFYHVLHALLGSKV